MVVTKFALFYSGKAIVFPQLDLEISKKEKKNDGHKMLSFVAIKQFKNNCVQGPIYGERHWAMAPLWSEKSENLPQKRILVSLGESGSRLWPIQN